MRVILDYVDRSAFNLYHAEIRTILEDLRKDIHKSKELLIQLQDRIKMLEDKGEGKENANSKKT